MYLFYLYPLSFIEFSDATGREMIAEEISHHQIDRPIAEIIHLKILEYLAEYFAVGGMPEAVSQWANTKDSSRYP